MLIDYKKVDIYHKDGAPVLHDVDFHVDEGEFIYVIGRVGSGKSSLLKTIYFEMDIENAENAFAPAEPRGTCPLICLILAS